MEKTTLQWFKDHWLKIVLLALPIAAGMFGIVVKVQSAPAGTDPQIVIVVPGLESEPLFEKTAAVAASVEKTQADREAAMLAQSGGRDRHPLINVARRFAGQAYARDHGLTRSEGRDLAFTVPAKMLQDRIDAEKMLGPGGWDDVPVSGGKLSDWLAAHPDLFNNLIKLLIMLIPLFADNHDIMPMVPPFDDVRTVRGPPFQPAWEPRFELAC